MLSSGGLRGRRSHGSIWTYDTPTETVERWNAQTYQGMFNTHVTDPPFYDGQCLNAIAADARAVWVTAMASTNYECLDSRADPAGSVAARLSRSSVSPQPGRPQ